MLFSNSSWDRVVSDAEVESFQRICCKKLEWIPGWPRGNEMSDFYEKSRFCLNSVSSKINKKGRFPFQAWKSLWNLCCVQCSKFRRPHLQQWCVVIFMVMCMIVSAHGGSPWARPPRSNGQPAHRSQGLSQNVNPFALFWWRSTLGEPLVGNGQPAHRFQGTKHHRR